MPDTTSSTTVNLRPPLWLPIIIVIIGGAFYLVGKSIETMPSYESPATISVSADAKVSISPDIAMASFGVQTGRQPSAKAAIDMVRRNMTTVLAAIKKNGVEDKDITTQSFWLSPVYDYTTGGQIPRGYEVNQSLSAKIRDLDKIGQIIADATAAGANQAGSISFSVDNPDEAKAQARAAAIEKAKAKAEVLARNLGMHLGRLTGFTEDGGYPEPPRPYMMKTMEMGIADSASPVPIPVGEQEIVSNVTLTYELR